VAPGDAPERVRTFKHSAPHLKVVLLALDDSQEEKVLACIQAGASGYVPTGGSLDDLAMTIEGAARCEMSCPAPMVGF